MYKPQNIEHQMGAAKAQHIEYLHYLANMRERRAEGMYYWSDDYRTPAGETLMERARKYGTGGWEAYSRGFGTKLLYLDESRSASHSWLLAVYWISSGAFLPARQMEVYPRITTQELERITAA